MNDSPLNSTDNPLGWLANSTTIWDPYEPTYSGADAYGAASVVVIVLDILLMIANVDRIILIRNTKVRMALFTFYALDVTQQLFAAIVYNQVLYASDAFRMGFASYVCYCLYAAEETVLSYMIYQTIASPIETMYPRLRWIPYILMGIEFCLGQIYAFIMAPNAYAYESSDLAVAALPIIQPLWSCWHLLFEIVVFGMLTKHMLAIKEAVVTSETENKGGGGNAKARPNKTFGFYLMVSMMMRLAICIGSEVN
ncbi:hypothetical protein HK104_001403 [Borealophlyctis nickersoniae]|nr:hypothetical protein HK104_001403 [Borealophlyctis nickersoniae]